MICQSFSKEPTQSESFASGYIAGLHSMSFGARSGEKVCAKHNTMLNDAVKKYVGTGVR